ncbi:MAG: C25 family cysteine peptidase, partial [candidate division WOR-3 bacterium]
NQEKIRNGIIDYWQNHGLKWVIVGGDAEIVPVRLARLTVEGITENIATDFYYADLQYSWDSNRNNYFGEMTDSVDLFHDIYVGRLPADNASDVQLFFNKCTTYERRPDSGYIRKVLYGSTMLFSPFHGRIINRMMAGEYPSGWTFAHLEDPGSGVYKSNMDQGFGLSHVAAHGNQTSFSVMSASECPSLSNGLRKLCYVNSIACQSGWFDGYECLAEALVKAPNGGAVAVMLNSRYGFGYPPGFGPSEMLDLEFYRYHIAGKGTRFGDLCGLSKDHFHSLTRGQEVWRWCVYELNLLGDPTLGVWFEPPAVLTVTRPDSALVGTQTFRVTVRKSDQPVRNALVCFNKTNETYARGWTNSQGWVDLLVSPASTGSIDLSVSAWNCYPYETSVPVRGSQTRPEIIFAGLRIDDSDGNGRLDPGETANLFVSLANAGAQNATSTNARLRSWSPYLTLLDSTASFGTIAVNDTVEGDAFRVTAQASTPNGTIAELLCAVTAIQGSWEPYFTTQVGTPPVPRRIWADHDTGNMILSMTSLGSIGTLGPYKEGSGLKYPRDAGYGCLYFTSLACGNSPDYVVDRWYGRPCSTFQRDWRLVDTLSPVMPPVGMHEELQAIIDDGNHPSPKGLTVTQWSGAVSTPAYDDFVIVVYTLANNGTTPINGLYCGIFSDFDVNNVQNNNVGTDASRRFTYMYGSSYNPSVGIKLLSPTTAANNSAIDHAVYVTPSSMMTEAVKDSFLRGAIRVPNSNRSANWSCVVSAGPFDLAPGARQKVAFALVGGTTQSELLANADSAQSFYDRQLPRGLTYLRSIIDDAPPGGNGDGLINPGEAINLPLWIVNRGDREFRGVKGILRRTGADTLVTVTDSTRYFGTVGSNDSAFTGQNGFKLRVAAACTNRYPLPLTLVCRDTLDSVYTSLPNLSVSAPQLVYAGIRCWDPRPGGNNNGKLDPGENAEIALGIANIGSGICQNVTATLKSGDARLAVLDSIGTYGNVPAESTAYNSADRFRVQTAGGIPPETEIPCTLRISGQNYRVTRTVKIVVGAITQADPIPDGPRQPALYWAYDDADSGYTEAPRFSWVELRGIGTRLSLSDDQTITINLPSNFGPFVFYGQSYTQISICSNGWVAPGYTTVTTYNNTELPNSGMPPALFVDWDDIYPPAGGGVWYWHDSLNHRFIVEWDSVRYYSGSIYDKYEIILYDTTLAASDGNCEFLYQYLVADGLTSCTVGEQDPTKTIAIQDLFNTSYHRGAAPITAGRAIKFTTDEPRTGLVETAERFSSDSRRFRLAPTVLWSRTSVQFALGQMAPVRVGVFDLTGREVRSLVKGVLPAGRHILSWDGCDDCGYRLAPGVYFVRVEAGSEQFAGKIVLLE